jgi:hypothetical protein
LQGTEQAFILGLVVGADADRAADFLQDGAVRADDSHPDAGWTGIAE